MIDLPEPVSPVTTVKPGVSDQASSSTRARLRIRREVSVAGTAGLWKGAPAFQSARMADLTITFLGTGTSLGVPMIGCDCRICRSPDPRDKRTRASIHVDTPDYAWLVDTGPDFRTQALRENVRRVDAVV